MEWYRTSTSEVLQQFRASEGGLSSETANQLQLRYGRNALPEEKPRTLIAIFFAQFTSPLVYILLVAGIIVFFMGDDIDAAVIFAALLINAVVGMVQEGRAEQKLSALKKFIESTARVIRDGREEVLPDAELVPGDIVVLREGDKVPADLRLFDVNMLKIDEAAITGESESVVKLTERIDKEGLLVGDQKNMAFKGTLVVSGYGRGVVVATGTATVVGAIAVKLSTIDAGMPLKENIEYLSKIILLVVIGFCIAIFFIGLERGIPVREMFATMVAIAVSSIPEGLPVVVTLVLATGVSRMSSRNVLVKRLQAVEALGQAKIIAVDKTGTITHNQMMVQSVYTNGSFFEVRGEGYEPKGEIFLKGNQVEPLNHPEVILFARTAILTATARVAYIEEKKQWQRAFGDPTEVAMLVFAEKLGFNKDTLLEENPQVMDIPFDSKRKFHGTFNAIAGKNTLSLFGAPEVVLARAEEVMINGKPKKLDKKDREDIAAALHKLSHEGLRVLAVAVNAHNLKTVHSDELPALCFVGFAGIADTIRSEVIEAVKSTQEAGMKVVMITGDHADTAEAIGRIIGIFQDGDVVMLGEEIESHSPEELAGRLSKVSVFARVSPDHKLKIIEAYRHKGEVIAMTGDGVNDALSLAAADLGVAMGKIGTEVAKEAADLILLDDNFGSIVAAVEEGRNIYKTIKKVLLYLLSTNVAEILVIATALLMGYDLPLTAGQLIWLNLVTDSFLVIALALEWKEPGLLNGVWKPARGFLFDLVGIERLLLMGSVMTLGTIIMYDQYLSFAPEKATTIALTLLAVFQWFNVFNCRSEKASVLAWRSETNMFLFWGIVSVVILQLVAVNVPFMQQVLHTTTLSVADWMNVIAAGLFIIMADELRKIFYRARIRRTPAVV